MKKSILISLMLIGLTSVETSAATHMKHYPELSILSGVELKVAWGGRILSAFINFYKDPKNNNATVSCLDEEEIEEAFQIESAVPDGSVNVDWMPFACYSF